MIDFQSSAVAEYQSHLAAIPRHARVLPVEEGRGEGESFGTEFHVTGEGELNHYGLQSVRSRSNPSLLSSFPSVQKSVFIRVHPLAMFHVVVEKKVEIAKRTQFSLQTFAVQEEAKKIFSNA